MEKEELFELFEQVFEISNKVAEMDRVPHDFGVDELLTRSEIHLVATIAEEEDKSVTELARIKGVTKGAVSQMLARLEKKGLIEKRTDPENNSRAMIRLTPKGRQANEGHDLVHEMICQAFLDGVGELDDKTFAFLKAFFSRIRQFIDVVEIRKV